MKIALALALLGSPFVSQATDIARYRLVHSTTQMNAFVDETSIKTDADTRSFWALASYRLPVAVGGNDRRATYSKRFITVDCSKRTMTVSKLLIFDADGLIADASSASPTSEAITPGTNSAAILNDACDGTPPNNLAGLHLFDEQHARVW